MKATYGTHALLSHLLENGGSHTVMKANYGTHALLFHLLEWGESHCDEGYLWHTHALHPTSLRMGGVTL